MEIPQKFTNTSESTGYKYEPAPYRGLSASVEVKLGYRLYREGKFRRVNMLLDGQKPIFSALLARHFTKEGNLSSLRLLSTVNTYQFLRHISILLNSKPKSKIKWELLSPILQSPNFKKRAVAYTFTFLLGEYRTRQSSKLQKEIRVTFNDSTGEDSLMFVLPMTTAQNLLPTLQNICKKPMQIEDYQAKKPIQLVVELTDHEYKAVIRCLSTFDYTVPNLNIP